MPSPPRGGFEAYDEKSFCYSFYVNSKKIAIGSEKKRVRNDSDVTVFVVKVSKTLWVQVDLAV